MSDKSTIEWTDATWNPITGCTLVSEGCRHCYAASLAATRLKHHPSRQGLARINAAGEAKFTGEVRLNENWLDQPLRWRKPRLIFVCAHGDLFHENVPDEWIDRVFAVMALARHHTFQVLTKRPERARKYIRSLPERARPVNGRAMFINVLEDAAEQVAEAMGRDGWVAASRAHEAVMQLPLPNVWLGTSVEDQATADARIPHLLATPAAVRFLSAEPLLGPVDLARIDDKLFEGKLNALNGMFYWSGGPTRREFARGIDWIIVGGESGPHARPMHPDWVRSLRDQCAAAGTAFFFKQWGEWAPWQPEGVPEWRCQDGRLIDGNILFPENMDMAPDWQDGLIESEGVSHAAFERVGKKAAGRLLDGRLHDEVPHG